MKRLHSFTYKFLFTVMAFVMLSSVAFAQGTTSINIANNSIGVGDTTTVTVQSSVDGKITVKYTASLLSVIDCSVSDYVSDGNTIEVKATEAVITFEGSAEGTASIIVSADSCAGSSATINVGQAGADTSDTAAEGTDTAPVDTVASGGAGIGVVNDEGGFDIDGVKYVVSERYSDKQILAGFTKKTIHIGTHTYNELTNGTILLVYLKPADNTKGDGIFYVYDEAAGTCSLFQYLGTKDNYVLVMPFSEEKPTDKLVDATLTTDSGTFNLTTIEGSDFYYFIGQDMTGATDWYAYDNKKGTIARADYNALALIGSTPEVPAYEIIDSSNNETEVTDTSDTESGYTGIENYQQKLSRFRIIVSVLIVICVILVFVIINLMIGKKGDDDDPFSKDVEFSPTSSRQRSIIFKEKSAEAEEEDDYYAEDEEEYEESEDASDSSSSDSVSEKKTGATDSSNEFLIDFNDL